MEGTGRADLIAFGNAGGGHLSTDMDRFLILLRPNNLGLAFLRGMGGPISVVK